MTDLLVYPVVWLNAAANAVGGWVLAPVADLPGWLSATLAAAASGVVFLLVFKYTSNQRAIKRVGDERKANLLALKLFKDNVAVTLRAQGALFLVSFRLLALSLVPTLVMVVPALLILGQLALWYQARPLAVGEDTVITMKLNGTPGAALPEVRLQPTSAVKVDTGPVRVTSQREVCWKVTTRERGYHRLVFEVDGQTVEKELAVGDGFMRVSTQRPGWDWSAVLLNPAERPFAPDSPVQSIEIEYPKRSSWTSGTNKWVFYWFAVSMAAAFCCRGWFNVKI
jgi:hypothetical protein